MPRKPVFLYRFTDDEIDVPLLSVVDDYEDRRRAVKAEVEGINVEVPRKRIRDLRKEDEEKTEEGPRAVFQVTRPQARFILGSRRTFQLFLGARAAGKSYALMLKALYLALTNPDVVGVVLSRTYNDADDTLVPKWEQILAQFERHTGVDLVAHYNKGNYRWTLYNGAVVVFRPFEKLSKVRGKTYGWVVLDEAEHASVSSEEVIEVVQFCMRDYPDAPHIFAAATTPEGAQGMTLRFLKAQQRGDPNHFVSTSDIYDAVVGGWLDIDLVKAFRASSSKAGWEQEGLGLVVKARAAIFAKEYSEQTHLIPWVWQDDLPYVLGVDWGEAHAYWCIAQIVTETRIVMCPRRGRIVLRPGTWVVARERKLEDVSRTEVRQSIKRAVLDIGAFPLHIGADRAVASENAWLRQTFKDLRGRDIRVCRSEDRNVRFGISALQAMLDPQEGPPRLYLADSLDPGIDPSGRGLRGAFHNYRRVVDPETGMPIDVILKDNVNDHPIDALRYVLVTSGRRPELHGGQVLPFFDARAMALRQAA